LSDYELCWKAAAADALNILRLARELGHFWDEAVTTQAYT